MRYDTMVAIHYDKISYNENILLDLPFREATGAITQDVAKPHHPVTLVNTPTWISIASGLGVLQLNGLNEYVKSLNADTLDLDFMATDYSIDMWINWTDTADDVHPIGRYQVDVSGWELYLLTQPGPIYYLTLRHHHASAAPSPVRTGAFSEGWTPGQWWNMGVSRSGTSAQFYRNGVAIDTTSDVLVDPETCNQDLVIGSRFTKDSEWYQGPMWRPRVWNRELSAEEFRNIYEIEKRWFP